MLCFMCCYVAGLGFRACLSVHASACIRKLEVCVCIQMACVHRPMYVHAYSCPETLIQVFMFLFLCSFRIIYVYFDPFIMFLSHYLSICILVCFTMLD